MKTTIFYFSATGNSLHTAAAIAEKLDDCTLVSIPGLRHKETIAAADERIGFVFPTHYFGLPPIVSEFIAKLKLDKVKYTFAVTTSGSNRHFSSALHQLEVLLANKRSKLDAGFHIDMISSYTPLSDLPPVDKMNTKLEQAELAIESGKCNFSITRQSRGRTFLAAF